MRVGFVRNVGLGALGLAVAVLAACNDDPLSFDNDATTGIFANPTVMIVPAGRESELETRAVNEGGEPTFAPVLVNGTQIGDQEVLNAGCVTVANNPLATELNPPGLFVVTGLNTLGSCELTLSAGGAEKLIEITIVADAIEFVDPPATVLFESTAQLEVQLIALDGSVVTPFDPTDVAWSSDDEAIATVDETGLVTGVAAGTAVITACWSGTEATGTAGLVERCADHTIEVVVPAPTLNSVSPASGLVGEVVTLDLTGLLEVHGVFLDGIELNPIYIESFDAAAGEIVFWWPYNGVGEHQVTVGSIGATSDPLTFELTSEGSSDDPDYLDPGTAPLTAIPFKKVAYLPGGDVVDQFYLIELAAQTVFDIDLDWDSGADLDILITDGAFANYVCNFNGATGAQPEATTCDLPAGQYLIWINSYDAAPGTYVLEVTPQ